jgi:selT/selW/selH-like putative selenoprotein
LVLKLRPSADVSLRRSSGGVFEVTVDGRLAFSKKAEGRFPNDEELVGCLG